MNCFIKANPELCMGCRTCMAGCAVAHAGEDFFYGNPDGFSFNPKLHMVKTAKISVPVQCKHCESPACMAACVEGCISIVDDAVILDQKNCIGCKACMTACPFGAIDMVTLTGTKQKNGEERVVANKCDLCKGIEGGPVCVNVCPTAALKLVKEEELEDVLEKRRVNAAKAIAVIEF